MRGRGSHAGPLRSGVHFFVLSMLSFFGCFYIAGRLWQDAQTRLFLIKQLEKDSSQGKATVSVEEKLNILDCNKQQNRLASLEMELAAAQTQGFVPMRLMNLNTTVTSQRLVALIGILTEFGHQSRRDTIRKTWVPTGAALQKLQVDKGIAIRFVIGRSANRGDSSDKMIMNENRTAKDFLVLDDHVEASEELPKKTKIFFKTAVETWDADFYIKVNDDVFINIDKLGAMLASHWDKPRAYIGCMKSGEVFTELTQKWYEPDWWKFGDKKSYFRHASGEVYVLSRALARFISVNSAILKVYAHEDVSTGAWMLGLNVQHVDERGMCCAGSTRGVICATR